MKKSLKIFISSTVKDLSPEREMAARAIETLKLEAIRAETYGSSPGTPAETCLEMVRDCDVFIGIYGGRYGYVPPGQSISATEMEFVKARGSGKDILIYIKGDVEPEDRQAGFLRRADDFEGGYFRRPPFRTLTELEEWIKEDLIALLSSRFVTKAQPEARTLVDDYCSYVTALYSNMSFAGIAQTPLGLSVPLLEVFVNPRLRLFQQHDSASPRTFSINEIASTNQRSLIVGAPGSGKTVLLKKLAVQIAQGNLQMKGRERSLPILVPLASWATRFERTEKVGDLGQHILRFVSSRTEPRFEPIIQDSFRSGHALVLLDGLDEIEGEDLRHTIANGVEAFCHAYPGIKVVLTTRPIGAVQISGFSAYEILPWTDQQIAKFVHLWSAALTMDLGLSAQPKEQAEALVKAITNHRGLHELARSPLFLTLLAFLDRQGYRLPTRRVELYDAVVRTMLGSWDRARSLSHTLPRRFDVAHVEHVLADLALEMMTRDIDVVSIEDVIELGQPETFHSHPNYAGTELPRFLKELTDRAAILIEHESGSFSFAHRTFQEFFAAKAVAALADEDVLAFIRAHYFEPRYEEIIRLALGWIDVHGGRQRLVGQAAEELLNAARA